MRRSPRKFSILKANIPVSFFGIILGLVGLGNCWRVSTKIWHLPSWIGEMIMLIAVVVWLVLLLAYIGNGSMEELAVLLFIGANLIIGSIALGTLRLLLRGKLLPPVVTATAV